MSPQNVTIYDVAREVGCAPSTVSRAFSRPGRVSAATHAKVMEAAQRLGYRTDTVPMQEQGKDHRRLGISVPDLTNPYFAELVSGIQDAAHEAGYLPILLDSTENDQRERTGLDWSMDVVDGVVLSGSRLADAALLQVAKRVPMVVLNRRVAGLDSISPDYELGLQQVVAHLRDCHVRTVMYIGGPVNSWSDGERWRSLRAAAADGLRVHKLGQYAPTVRGGEQAYQDAVAQGRERARPALPQAVICYNDLQAMGFQVSAMHDDVRVPGELSVIGHDDIPMGRLIGGGLSTVATPKREQGRAGAERLIRRIRSPSTIGRPTEGVVPVRLIVRGSSGPVGA